MAAKTEFGTGSLFTIANTVYGVLVCHVLLVLVNLPLVLSPLYVSLFGVTPAGAVLFLAASLPVGPAAVAAAYTCNRLIAGKEGGSVARMFLQALTANAKEAGAVWLPALGVLALIAFNLLNLGTVSAEVQPALRAALLMAAILACTVTANALLIVSRFRFRTIDVIRLAFSCIGAQKRATLGNLAIIVLTAWVLAQTTVFLLLVIGGALVYLLSLNSRPMLRFIEHKFTTEE